MSFTAVKPTSDDQPLLPDAKNRGRVYENILQTIGGTPLVRLSKLKEKYGLEADILAKLEFFNPLGSVKDRIGFAMIEAAERAGDITPGNTIIVEPTSGNTGIGLALVCAAKGYKLILTMPESMSIERRRVLKLYGAELALTPAEKGMKGAIERAKEIRDEHENSYMPSQFTNPANPRIHAETTALEIWNDTEGAVDVVVAGIGTGGTLTGIADTLKPMKEEMTFYAIEPEDSPVLSGGDPGPHKIQGIGAGFVPEIVNPDKFDGVIKVSNEETFEYARMIARLEGVPAGISSGAAIKAAIEVAQMPENKGKTIVTILASYAERYISTALFEGLD